MATIKPMDLGEIFRVGYSESYLIKNKNTVLGEFEWSRDGNDVMLTEDYGLPFFISSKLDMWIANRTPPKHRAFMDRLLAEMQLSSTKAIIDYSKGLALTDTLWVVPKSSTLTWEQVSLFRTDFDETIAKIAFDGGVYGRKFSTTSPEFGTDGMLPKCWVRRNGKIQLIKGGLSGAYNAGHEPASEVMSHQVLERLGYTHTAYSMETRMRLSEFSKKPERYGVSCCDLFTDESTMLLPIHVFFKFDSMKELIEEAAKVDLAPDLARIMVFDYLSLNSDRHAGNIGVLLDADTFELKSLAPIYDNGYGMLAQWMPDMSYVDYERPRTPRLYNSFENGAIWGKRILGNQHNVERLIDFNIDRSQLLLETDERIDGIEKWFKDRVRKFMSLK